MGVEKLDIMAEKGREYRLAPRAREGIKQEVTDFLAGKPHPIVAWVWTLPADEAQEVIDYALTRADRLRCRLEGLLEFDETWDLEDALWAWEQAALTREDLEGVRVLLLAHPADGGELGCTLKDIDAFVKRHLDPPPLTHERLRAVHRLDWEAWWGMAS